MKDVLEVLEAQQRKVQLSITSQLDLIARAEAKIEMINTEASQAEQLLQAHRAELAKLQARLYQFERAHRLLQKTSMVDPNFLKEVRDSDVV